jgi:hypothetical protein
MAVGTKVETFYVAPDGSDAWSGRLARPNPRKTDGPLATVRAARDAARKLGTGKARICLRAGEYFLDKPLVLTARDSGLTIEAARGAAVVLYGGRPVTGWRREGEHLWSAALPDVAARKWDFRMLVVNGRFCERARLPSKGHFTHVSEFRVPWMTTTGGGWKRKPTKKELTTLRYRPQDLGPWLDVHNAELTIYHMWDESVVGIAAMDEKTHTLTLAQPTGHPPGAFGVRKYVVWNVRRGLGRRGQWMLDRTAGKVVYWPLDGEDMTKAKALAPTTESIVRIQGGKAQPARDITLRGLTLSVTNTPLVAGGFGAGRFDGAVWSHRTENCRLLDLEIVNVGGQGVKGWDDRALRIERCHIHHTGACGVKLGGTGGRVTDCRIHHVGRTYPSAIGLWGSGRGGKGHVFSHNEIHDTPYTAVACAGEDHRIEHNLIYRAMQELHDGAGIYITFCKRIVLRGNFIRDILDTGGYGASAYYLDEQAEDCLVEGNLSLRVRRPSHNHMARKNTVRNNVFVVAGDATLTFPRSSSYRFEKNVLYAKGRITFTNPAAIGAFADNVIFSGAGKVVGRKLHKYRAADSAPLKPGAGSIFADPKLLEYETGRVRFAADSPARKLGIREIDVSAAGPRAESPPKKQRP